MEQKKKEEREKMTLIETTSSVTLHASRSDSFLAVTVAQAAHFLLRLFVRLLVALV